MALSTNTYTASAAQTDFTVGFPYLSTDHVEVYVDDVLKTIVTDYTFPSASTVRFGSGMVGGEIVFIKRVTSHTARLVDYESGGTLNEEDLDTDSIQAFYMVQEAIDVATAALFEDATDNKFDAESKIIKSVLPGVASTDAVNKAQLDAISAAAGNVPTPSDPADDLKLLQADGGSFTFEPVLSAFMKTVLDDTSADDVRTTLGAAASTALQDVVDDTSPKAGAAFSMNSFQMRWAKGADVVATATLPILADGNFFTVTGNTGITQIAQMAVGTVIMLHFTGTPTLTHDATNLILPGGSDIVVAAGDVAMFVEYAAGDWRMLNYQLATPTTSAFEFVSSTALSVATTIATPTDFVAGYDYIIGVHQIAPATDGNQLRMRVSTDGGDNWKAGASDYNWTAIDNSVSGTGVTDTYMGITRASQVGSDANGNLSVDITAYEPVQANTRATFSWIGMMTNILNQAKDLNGGASYIGALTAVNAVQFHWSSGGNFKAQGDLVVWRRKRS